MISAIIVNYITFIYFLAFLFYLLMMVIKKEIFGKIATGVILVGLIGHTASIILRWVESHIMGIGHVPLSNMYESLVFFAWAIILFYYIIEFRTKNKSMGTFITPLAFLAMAYASFYTSADIKPLLPALQSNWLTVHVITCFFGYAAFALAFGMSIMYLIKRFEILTVETSFLRFIPETILLDNLSYQMIVIGFLMLTLGIITGSVWAHSAWGTYWSWDPKETWSLITWLVYATLLHSRLIRGWKGKKLAILSIIGFICVLFTYFGVNYILSGLHSYA